MNYQQLQEQCENLLRAGQTTKCREILTDIKFEDLPRSRLAPYCALARRANLLDTALRALRPVIRPAVQRHFSASTEEIVEYAKGLLRVGAFHEADQLLEQIQDLNDPQVALTKGYSCIFQWNYRQALDHLNTYLATADTEDYSALVARVNRLACFQFLDHPEFVREFEILREYIKQKPFNVLHANILEIFSQHLIDHEDWTEAESFLADAGQMIVGGTNSSRDLHWIQKWKRILHALKRNSISQLEAFRAEALNNREWETLRTLDFYRVKIDPESEYAYKVFYGTPFLSFRLKLSQLRPYPKNHWLGQGAQKFDSWFPGYDEGTLAHRTAMLLLRDLYRPLLPSQIFSALHDDEYLNLDSLNGRVRKIISRLKKWIDDHSIPLTLINLDGAYSLRIKTDSSILCHEAILPLDKLKFFFLRYLEAESIPVTTSQWAQAMQVKDGAASKMLNAATKANLIIKQRAGRENHYLIKRQPSD